MAMNPHTNNSPSKPRRMNVRDLPLWLMPSVLTIVCLLISSALGNLVFPIPEPGPALRDFNAALAMPIMIGYFWLAGHILHNQAYSSVTSYFASNVKALSQVSLNEEMDKISNRNTLLAAALGTSFALAYMSSESLLAVDLKAGSLFLNILAIVFWISTIRFVLQQVSVTRFVIRHFLQQTNIDMFGAKKLKPVSDLVVTNTILASLGFALVPLFWVGNQIPIIDKLVVLGFLIFLVIYLFRPVFKVQQEIARHKRLSVKRINNSIKELFQNSTAGQRRLTDDNIRLRKLSALISAKSEIANVSEWPIDLPQRAKTIAVFIGVPLSWAAASIIESYITNLCVFG